MAPAILRLKRRVEFLRVAGSGKKWVSPGLILQARRRGKISPTAGSACSETPTSRPGWPTPDDTRLGFTVSKKVGNSVARSRAKRRLRAACAEVLPLHLKSGYDLVVIGRKNTLTRPFSTLLKDLEAGLKKLDLYQEALDLEPEGKHT